MARCLPGTESLARVARGLLELRLMRSSGGARGSLLALLAAIGSGCTDDNGGAASGVDDGGFDASVESLGRVAVLVVPEEARLAGATWRVDGGERFAPGHVARISSGEHTIEAGQVDGWLAPEPVSYDQGDDPAIITLRYRRLSPRPVILRRVHLAREVSPLGCDVYEAESLACREAGLALCTQAGYASGGGPVQEHHTIAELPCVDAGQLREYAFTQTCSAAAPTSIFCSSLARRSCREEGFATSLGVVGAGPAGIRTVCVDMSTDIVELPTTFSAIEAALPDNAACTSQAAIDGIGCRDNAQRLCASQGYDVGFGPLEYDAVGGSAVVACARSSADDAGLVRAPGVDGFERAARIGTNVLGGPGWAERFYPGAGHVTLGDAIVNQFDQPIAIRRFATATTYVPVPPDTSYTRDACLDLNRVLIFQADDNDDGELTCVYTDAAEAPVVDLGEAGAVLAPGERVIFQGQPQAGSTQHDQITAELEVTFADDARPVRRVRFPRWDTAYMVSDEVSVPAGSVGTDNVPLIVPAEKPLQESNAWYPVTTARSIRGVSIFLSNGTPAGVQGVEACVRVAAADGADLMNPACFELSADRFSPAMYEAAFGPGGAGFLPLDLSVPAGAQVGVDFRLHSEAPGAMDFAAFVWLDSDSG